MTKGRRFNACPPVLWVSYDETWFMAMKPHGAVTAWGILYGLQAMKISPSFISTGKLIPSIGSLLGLKPPHGFIGVAEHLYRNASIGIFLDYSFHNHLS